MKRYTERRTTRFEHADEIKHAYGLRDFAEAEGELTTWVDARAWTTGDGRRRSSPTRWAGCVSAASCCPG